MHVTDQPATGRNHPLAPRMGAIAFLSHNCTMAAAFSAFGVMMIPIEQRLGVGRTVSASGVSLIMLCLALLGPLVGGAAARHSVRTLMSVGSLMAAAGYAMLASTASVPAYFAAYGLLVGPGTCLAGVILPALLTARWFQRGRGRAIGFVHMPLLMAAMPLAAAAMLRGYGLPAVYWGLAGVMLVAFVAQRFVIDFPTSAAMPAGGGEAVAADPGLSTGALLRRAGFWKLVLAQAMLTCTIVMLGAHLVPMAIGWHIDPTRAATLLAMFGAAGIAGAPLFGWLGDRVGGRVVFAILLADLAIVLALMLTQPSFALLTLLVPLLGLHTASVPASFALASTEQFGQASYGRANGLSQLISLPFIVAAVPVAAAIYDATGSYAGALLLHVGLLAFGFVLLLTLRKPATASAAHLSRAS